MATTPRTHATLTTAARATTPAPSTSAAARAIGRRAGDPSLSVSGRLSERRGPVAIGLACLLTLGACSGSNPFSVSDLPESPEVETSAWPSLASAPAPRSQTGETGVIATVAKGDEIRTDIDTEVARLRADVTKLEARPVIAGNLSSEAARLRAKARALAARQ